MYAGNGDEVSDDDSYNIYEYENDIGDVSNDDDGASSSSSYDEFSRLDDVSRKDHGIKILKILNDHRKNNSASVDLRIKILIDENAVELSVHKSLASTCSPYIKSCFDNMSESHASAIDLSHLNGESVTEIINWIYTGVCNLTTKNVKDILISADFLQIDQIKKASVDFILSNITYENCSDMYMLSNSYKKVFRFQERVLAYILPKFYTLFSESHLNGLPLEDILDISSSDDLILFSHKFIDLDPADHEFKLFQMIKGYLEAKNLQDFWFDFLTKSIRVFHLTVDQINDLIKDQRWLENCTKKDECIDLLQDVRDKKEQNSLDFKYQIPLAPRKHLKGFKYSITEVIVTPGVFTESVVPFNDLDSELKRINYSLVMIRGMKVFLKEWNGVSVVGGVEVTYTDGTKYTHGFRGDIYHEFQLGDREYINNVQYKFDEVVYGLTFYTNLRKKYGRYGARGRLLLNLDPSLNCQFLAAVSGETTTYRNSPFLMFMHFHWGQIPTKNLKMYF